MKLRVVDIGCDFLGGLGVLGFELEFKMSSVLENLVNQPYQHGFVTDIESDTAAKGLSEDTIRFISAKKSEPEWLLEFRLKAYRHWLTMTEPKWPNVKYPKIDFQDIIYYSAPKAKKL